MTILSPRHYRRAAYAFWNGYQPQNAVLLLQHGLESFPDDPGLMLVLGQFLSLAGEHDEGIALLRKRYELMPTVTSGAVLLAHAYNRARRFEDAIDLLNTIPLSNSGRASYSETLMVAHRELGNMDEAIRIGVRRMVQNPLDSFARVTLMSLYIRAGRPDIAVDMGEESLKGIKSEKSQRLVAQRGNMACYAVLMHAHTAMGNPERAIHTGEKSRNINPYDMECLHRLAIACLNAKRPKHALKLATEACRLQSHSIDSQELLMTVNMVLGNDQAAIDAGLKARRLDPEDPSCNIKLMSLYVRNNRWGEAIALGDDLKKIDCLTPICAVLANDAAESQKAAHQSIGPTRSDWRALHTKSTASALTV